MARDSRYVIWVFFGDLEQKRLYFYLDQWVEKKSHICEESSIVHLHCLKFSVSQADLKWE